MQFVWQHRLGLRQGMTTVDGRRVCVVDQGLLNNDAGPDFLMPRLKSVRRHGWGMSKSM